MSEYTTKEVWERRYGTKEEVCDYTGRKMLKSAIKNPKSQYYPTLDHIRPISGGGADSLDNIEVCHRTTNEEKADKFPHWNTKGKRYKAIRIKGSKTGYRIVENI